MKNLAIERLGAFMVLVHNENTPLASEWDELLATANRLEIDSGGDIARSSTVIFTDGGAPNTAQRKSLQARLKGKPAPSVVITDNIMVRGISAVIGLFNRDISVYGSKDWKSALVRARVPEERYAEFLDVARRLALQVGGCQAVSSVAE